MEQKENRYSVIFLDIDGVLNTGKNCFYAVGHSDFVFQAFDQKAVENLNKIIEKTNAKIVISSNWRIFCDSSSRFNALIDHFRQQNVKGIIVGKTPVFSDDESMEKRGLEIQQWLDEHPLVDSFVIIDDHFPPSFDQLKEFVVKTNKEEGIEKKHIKEAVRILMRG